jgi:F420-dependent oxidoreductase-like protein
MRIGVLIGDVRGPAGADDLRAQARAAAGAGLDRVWAAQALGWDALAAVTVAGTAAPRTALGTAVVPVPQRHPLVLAGQALSAQAATGNRLTLGIGAGIGAMVQGMFGLPADRPAARMREYLGVLRPLLRGEHVEHHGPTLTTVGSAGVPGAVPPRVVLAALGPAMRQVAADLADGVVTWMAGPRTLEGFPVERTTAGFLVCVTGDEDGARARIAGQFAMAGQVPEYRAVFDREGVDGAQDVAIVGDEEAVARRIRSLAGIGIGELMACPFGDAQEQARTLELLQAL